MSLLSDNTPAPLWEQLGAIALGSRLRRLSELLVEQVSAVYTVRNIDLHPRFFPVLAALRIHEPQSVGKLAQTMGLTHTALVQTLALMKKEDLVRMSPSPDDSRRSDVSLTPKAKRLIRDTIPVWDRLREILESVLSRSAPNLLAELGQLEKALGKSSLADRFPNTSRPDAVNIEIREWSPEYQGAFRDLNEEWLLRYFSIEAADQRIFADPHHEIIAPGGMIFFAKRGALIAGTCAVLKIDGSHYELAKMAVSENFQGEGIGRALLHHAIQWARDRGAHIISLESSRKLGPALKLYESAGFEHTRRPAGQSDFARADVYMELHLSEAQGGTNVAV